MSTAAHVLVSFITVSSLAFILRLVRQRQMRPKYSLIWLSVGLVMVIFAVSPRLLDRVSLLIGIPYGPTTLFLAAITLLLFLSLQFSWELSRLENQSRTLAEEIAILRAERGGREASDGA